MATEAAVRNGGRRSRLFKKGVRRMMARLSAAWFLFVALAQFARLRRCTTGRFSLRLRDLKLCLSDATQSTSFDRHYVFHTAWASRVLAQTRPRVHTDIASSLYFVANVSAFVSTEFYDYRPAQLGLSNLRTERGDLHALPFATGSLQSVSCMHVVEHVGLARYGDSLDYDGDLKAIAELKRVVAAGGSLLLVVPICGTPTIAFNAHRIYAYRQVLAMMAGFALREFALIPDDESQGGLIRDASEQQADAQRYGCGCFWFEKLAGPSLQE